ncbi:MAG: hypothetical protein DMG21_15255 [Acidobacteria bacterium]|nr:MAG: hypothetical protein DMG21_15255 [Acidobacteriota bacterium]
MKADERKYLVDTNGNRIGVVLNIADYEQLLENTEELESIRAFDRAKSSGEKPIPFEQAVSDIDRRRG